MSDLEELEKEHEELAQEFNKNYANKDCLRGIEILNYKELLSKQSENCKKILATLEDNKK